MGANGVNADDRAVNVTTGAVRLGLTGGIGSGKSTVAAMLRKLQASVVDADVISRQLTCGQGPALSQIASIFGAEFIEPSGALNREKMRKIVFQSHSAKSKLERILHPLIRREMLAQADFAAAQGLACVVFDVPLLVESGTWRNFVDTVLVVDCTPETQLMRVKARNGLSDAAVRNMMVAQASREERLRAADIVVFNDNCSLEQLASTVSAIAPEIGL